MVEEQLVVEKRQVFVEELAEWALMSVAAVSVDWESGEVQPVIQHKILAIIIVHVALDKFL